MVIPWQPIQYLWVIIFMWAGYPGDDLLVLPTGNKVRKTFMYPTGLTDPQ